MRKLDVGCGYGDWLLRESREGYEVVGVDIRQESVDKCREKGLYTSKINAGKELPFADDSFDLVHCYNVIEHLNPSEVRYLIGEMHRVLKQGGVLELGTPHPNNPVFWDTFSHVKPYSPKALLELFDEGNEEFIGFGMEKIELTYNKLALIGLTKSFVLKLKKGEKYE